MVKKRSFLASIMFFLLIYVIITMVWQLLEIFIYGKIETRNVDTIIAIFLAFSIYMNVKFTLLLMTSNKEKTNGITTEMTQKEKNDFY